MWKLKGEAEGRTKEENAKVMKAILEDLKSKIDVIQHLEVGINFTKSDAAFDVALYSEFKSREDLEKYINHPEHKRVVEFINKVREERYIVDYEI